MHRYFFGEARGVNADRPHLASWMRAVVSKKTFQAASENRRKVVESCQCDQYRLSSDYMSYPLREIGFPRS